LYAAAAMRYRCHYADSTLSLPARFQITPPSAAASRYAIFVAAMPPLPPPITPPDFPLPDATFRQRHCRFLRCHAFDARHYFTPLTPPFANIFH
jgi:hypothetical protein